MDKKFKFLLIILTILFLSVGLNFYKNEGQSKKSNIAINKYLDKVEIKELDEYSFLQNLAKTQDISYDEAMDLNNKYKIDNANSENIVIKYAEKIQPYSINDDMNVVMIVDFKYIHNKDTNKNKIISVGSTYINLNGEYEGIWSGSKFNKYIEPEEVRISTTGQILVEIKNKKTDVSGLQKVMEEKNSLQYASEIETYAMTINIKEL